MVTSRRPLSRRRASCGAEDRFPSPSPKRMGRHAGSADQSPHWPPRTTLAATDKPASDSIGVLPRQRKSPNRNSTDIIPIRLKTACESGLIESNPDSNLTPVSSVALCNTLLSSMQLSKLRKLSHARTSPSKYSGGFWQYCIEIVEEVIKVVYHRSHQNILSGSAPHDQRVLENVFAAMPGAESR